MNLTSKELATVHAALRYWQSEAISLRSGPTGTVIRPTACNQLVYFEEDEPLNKQEIDKLCEKLNTGDREDDLACALDRILGSEDTEEAHEIAREALGKAGGA